MLSTYRFRHSSTKAGRGPWGIKIQEVVEEGNHNKTEVLMCRMTVDGHYLKEEEMCVMKQKRSPAVQ